MTNIEALWNEDAAAAAADSVPVTPGVGVAWSSI